MTSAPLSASLRASLERSTETYQSQLDDAARAYLAGRALGPHAIATHRLGVVRDPRPGDERFLGRLAIPYLGPKGNVYGTTYRCMGDHDCKELEHPKYDRPAGIPGRMFNTVALTAPTDYIFVTEGEIDCMSITECGWPAVGMPGANGWRPHHARMLAGFSKVILLADPDEAGSKFASSFTRSLPQSGSVILCQYKEARDVNDVLRLYGKDGLVELLKEEA